MIKEEEISLDDLAGLIDGSEESEENGEEKSNGEEEVKDVDVSALGTGETELEKMKSKEKDNKGETEQDEMQIIPIAEQDTSKPELKPGEEVEKGDDDLASLLGGDKEASEQIQEKKEEPKPTEATSEDELKALEDQVKEYIEDIPTQEDNQGLPEEPDRVLLYGASKVGKTHAVASMMEVMLKANPETNFYVIVTDAGFLKTVKRYWKLRKLDISTLKKQLNYYPILDINEMFSVIKDIKSVAKKSDWIIVDVMSDFWELAQDKFIDSCSDGITGIADLIVEASRDTSKFGILSGFQWGYCKRLDNSISYYFVINAPCNVIATASEKDIDVVSAIAGEDATEQSLGSMYGSFKTVGFRPAGQKHLSYKFDDIVFLGKLGTGKRFFSIIGSRDIDTTYEQVPYATSFWEPFVKHKKDVLEKEVNMDELAK